MCSATGRASHRHWLDEDQCVAVSCRVFRCDSSDSVHGVRLAAHQCYVQEVTVIHTRSGIFMAALLERAAPICGCMWEFKGLWEDVMGGFCQYPLHRAWHSSERVISLR